VLFTEDGCCNYPRYSHTCDIFRPSDVLAFGISCTATRASAYTQRVPSTHNHDIAVRQLSTHAHGRHGNTQSITQPYESNGRSRCLRPIGIPTAQKFSAVMLPSCPPGMIMRNITSCLQHPIRRIIAERSALSPFDG
jgi:hypothetical protein